MDPDWHETQDSYALATRFLRAKDPPKGVALTYGIPVVTTTGGSEQTSMTEELGFNMSSLFPEIVWLL